MAEYDVELLSVSALLLQRQSGRRGRLHGAWIRRSISTTYYAIFHFLLDEAGLQMVGAHNDLRRRRRIFARTMTHAGLRIALTKVQGPVVDQSVGSLLRTGATSGPQTCPLFVQTIAKAFLDAQAKREDADYDLNKPLSEADARLLHARVTRAIAGWRQSNSNDDRDFKSALSILLLLRGQIRREA